ncbi:hypothetical protein TRVA0_031S00386 [Trichomonascus vanleenenianus]|uniref:uncharacterized protein n=1 Tax=Trichomonascus vanleenenianus TaxID=2268995 RepID=UPI003ECB9F50
MAQIILRILALFAVFSALIGASPVEAVKRNDDSSLPVVSGDFKTKSKTEATSDMPEVSAIPTGETTKDSKKTDSKDNSKTDSKDSKDSKTTDSKNDKSKTDSKNHKKTTTTSDHKKKTSSTAFVTPTSIDPRSPPGGIAMVTPVSTSSTYIKIGDYATFKWKYTSLIVTPQHINILAYCSQNQQTVTIATNHPSRETELVWDTGKSDENPSNRLIVANYKLEMFDSKGNMSMSPRPGYLEPLSYTIGLYRKQSYTPEPGIDSYTNGGSIVDETAFKWLVAMGVIVVGSALHMFLA